MLRRLSYCFCWAKWFIMSACILMLKENYEMLVRLDFQDCSVYIVQEQISKVIFQSFSYNIWCFWWRRVCIQYLIILQQHMLKDFRQFWSTLFMVRQSGVGSLNLIGWKFDLTKIFKIYFSIKRRTKQKNKTQ